MLLYHLVCTIKYRKNLLTEEVKDTLVNACIDIEERYKEVNFIEIGIDENHVHMLLQITPRYSVSQVVRIIKSITAKKIFKINPEVKKKLWGGEFWSDGYWIVTIGKHGSEKAVREYVKNQGNNKYKQLYLNL